ncbi:hypothetical protein OSTOST_12608, partial [Ostertagia ostertagi]
LTHDHPNEIELLDDLLSEQLRDLKESKALQNTMLIIMGDHGNRVTRMSRTFAGKIGSEIDRSTMLRSLKRYLKRHQCVKRSSVQCQE